MRTSCGTSRRLWWRRCRNIRMFMVCAATTAWIRDLHLSTCCAYTRVVRQYMRSRLVNAGVRRLEPRSKPVSELNSNVIQKSRNGLNGMLDNGTQLIRLTYNSIVSIRQLNNLSVGLLFHSMQFFIQLQRLPDYHSQLHHGHSELLVNCGMEVTYCACHLRDLTVSLSITVKLTIFAPQISRSGCTLCKWCSARQTRTED